MSPEDQSTPSGATSTLGSESSSASEAGSLSQQPPRLLFALLVVGLGSLLGPLDTAVNVAFPLITASFALSLSDIQWIIAAYIIAQSGLTLAFGQLGDLYGHRRVFRLGLAACALSHLLCALAPSYPWLILARAVQGVSVGLAMACAPALATLIFPAGLRRTILAIYVMLMGAGIALGPLIGGLLLDWGGWPTVFWFRTPLALLVLLATLWIPEPHIERNAAPRFDALGALLLTLSLTSLVLLINLARRPDGAWWLIVGQGLLLLAFARAFVWQERRFPQPILHVRYLASRRFRALQVSSVMLNMCGFSIFLLLPYVLDRHLHASSMMIGLILAAAPIGSVMAGMLGARRILHWPGPVLMNSGLGATAAGLAAIGLSLPLQSLAVLALCLFATGLGIGTFQFGYMDETTGTLPPAERGVAGSLLNVTRVVGAVVGAASITWLHSAWRSVYVGYDANATALAGQAEHAARAGLGAYAASFITLGSALAVFGLMQHFSTQYRARLDGTANGRQGRET